MSNLTNLLAFAASGLSFAGFAALMTMPLLAVVAVEYLVIRRFFAADLATPPQPAPTGDAPLPRYPLAVLAVTLPGFAVAGPLGVHPAWVATAGAAALAVPWLRRDPRRARQLLAAADPAFCGFVAALAVVVLAVRRHGLDRLAALVTPHRADLLGLLAVAGIAAVLANVVNNLPATLVLVPAVAPSTGLVLAVLIGVNVGPNLTYVGSLATLLSRRILHRRDAAPPVGEYLRLGALSVPGCLVAGVAALWLGLRLSGAS